MSIVDDIRDYAGAARTRLSAAAADANEVAAQLSEQVRELAGRARGAAAGVAGQVRSAAAELPERVDELRASAERDPRLARAVGAVEDAAGTVIEKVIIPAAGLVGYRLESTREPRTGHGDTGAPGAHQAET